MVDTSICGMQNTPIDVAMHNESVNPNFTSGEYVNVYAQSLQPVRQCDFSKFDLSKFDMTKMLGDVKIPGFDMQAIMDAQRKNIEALTAANQTAVQGMQAVAQRQAEILSQAMSEVSSIAQQLAGSASNPQEMTAKQAELVRKAFEQALANARELAEMVSKSNTEAFAIINKRVTESLQELKSAGRRQVRRRVRAPASADRPTRNIP